MATSPTYPTTTPLDPSIYDPNSGVGKFGAQAMQTLANNQAVSMGNNAFKNATTNYQTALANWKMNGSKGPPPTAPDPNQIYHGATDINAFNSRLPGGGGSVGSATTAPWQLSPTQAQGLSPSPGGGSTAGSGIPSTLASPTNPANTATANWIQGGAQGPPPGTGGPATPPAGGYGSPGQSPTSPISRLPINATRPGGAIPTPGGGQSPTMPQRMVDAPQLGAPSAAPPTPTAGAPYASPSGSPTAVGAAGQVGPSTAGTPTYNPTSPTNNYSGSAAGLNFPAPFGTGMTVPDEVSNSTGLTQQIVSGYNNAVGGGANLQAKYGGYADANAQRAASLQGQLAGAYAPIAAGQGGYTPTQASSILQQPGLDALPTSQTALQSNYLTPEEQAQIAWTPQNTQDLLAQNANTIQAGTQAQKDAIDIAAQKQGASSPLQVQAMKDRATQAGLAATGDSATNARLAAAQRQEQQAQILAQNRQGVNLSNQGTQYNQGMDINQLESGRNKSVADTNVAAGQEYRNQYLGGQEQQASQNTQVGNQQQLGAYTSQGAATNQSNQVGVENQRTGTPLGSLLGINGLGFARGGVVRPGTPQSPMQGPKPALVGEAGPEAIVPLGPPRISLRGNGSNVMMRHPGRLLLGSGMDRIRAMEDGGAVQYGGDSSWEPEPMDTGNVIDNGQYPIPTRDPLAGPGATPQAQKRSAWQEPSTWREIAALGVGALAPRFGGFGPLISGEDPNKPQQPWERTARAAAGAMGRNHFADSSTPGQSAPSVQQQADTTGNNIFYANTMHNPDPGQLSPWLSVTNLNKSTNIGPGGGAPSRAPAPAPTPSPTTTPRRTGTQPVWNPTIGQQHIPPPTPTTPAPTPPTTSPTTAPTAPGEVTTKIGYPGLGVPPTTLPPGTVGSPSSAPGGSSSTITGPEGFPLPTSGEGGQTTIDYGGSGTPGQANPPGYGDYPGMFNPNGDSSTTIDYSSGFPGYNNGSPPNLVPGGGQDPVPPYLFQENPNILNLPSPYDTVGSTGYPPPGGLDLSGSGGFANAGGGDYWHGGEGGDLYEGDAKGAVYAPPQTRFGPTQIVDKPTYMTLGKDQPQAVVPLRKNKPGAKVKPKDVPKLVAKYGSHSR